MINSSNQAGHGQLFLSSLSPLLSLLLFNFISGIANRKSLKYNFLNGVSFSVLLALTFFTGFYIPWFFCLFVLLFFFVFLLTRKTTSIHFLKIATSRKLLLFTIFASFLVFTLPFLMVYLPNLKQTGGQSFSSQLGYSLHIIDIFNIGDGSLIWGRIFTDINNHFDGVWRDGEYRVGFTPDVLLAFFISSFYLFYKKNHRSSGFVSAVCIVATILFLLPLSINNLSPWIIVNKIIPGASGVRAICRIYLILALPICLVIGLSVINLKLNKYTSYALFGLLITSQINITPPVNISANDELSIKKISAPPIYCKSFYVKNPINNLSSLPQNDIYSQNTQAMIIADSVGIPTLNGFASFTPNDWIFKQTPSYLYRVNKYILNHNLNSICALDIKSNTWEAMNEVDALSDIPTYNLGNKVIFSKGGNSGDFTDRGWSIPEDFGTWTDGDMSTIIMKFRDTSVKPTRLLLEASAFLSKNKKNDFTVDILINNKIIGTLNYNITYGENMETQEIKIPDNSLNTLSGAIEIKFVMHPTLSPYDLGLSLDTRKLGLGVKSLTLL